MDFSNEKRNSQIAQYLEALRHEQNLTLEEVSKRSSVPVSHLTSLEKGRFSHFDDFYLRTYLKRYASALGVDLEQLLAYIEQQTTGKDPVKQAEAQQKAKQRATTKKQKMVKRTNVASIERRRRILKFFVSLGFIALIVGMIFFITTIFANLSRPDTDPTPPAIENPHDLELSLTPEPEEEDEAEETPPSEEEVIEEPEDEVAVEFIEQVGNRLYFDIETASDVLDLIIELNGDAWIDGFFNNVATDSGIFSDEYQIYLELEAGENNLNLNIGAMHQVESMTLAGLSLEFPEGLVGVHRLVLNIIQE